MFTFISFKLYVFIIYKVYKIAYYVLVKQKRYINRVDIQETGIKDSEVNQMLPPILISSHLTSSPK